MEQPAGWVISEQVTHPPLVSEADFVTVQAIYTTPAPADGSSRDFALSGLLFCQLCGRRLTAHWMHGRAGYRRRHRHTTAQLPKQDRHRNVYVRQDQILLFLATHVPHLRQLGDSAAVPT